VHASLHPAETPPADRHGLVPVGRQTLHQSVYEELRRALMNGTLHSGQVLAIVELAATLGTSTMPVRDALSRLVAEKALEALPNRSVRVPPITVERLDDLLRARLLVEGMAVELATRNIQKGQFERLHANLASHDEAIRQRRAGNVDAETRHNHDFHFQIYQAAGSEVLLSIIESLWLQSGPVLWMATKAFAETDEQSGTRHHHELVAAIGAQDVAAARRALADDIGRAFSLLRAQVEVAPPPVTARPRSRP
jgi:DNA-binding GntR family transcriptional regulator